MKIRQRLKNSLKAAALHLCISVFLGVVVAILVFLVWFPYPYDEMLSGRELFFMILAIDVVCGPILTLILYNPLKTKWALTVDFGLIALLQMLALAYGLWSLHLARPLYLVHEIDRFQIISAPDVDEDELLKITKNLQLRFFERPIPVSLKEPGRQEQQEIMFASLRGGKDYGYYPKFYTDFNGVAAYEKGKSVEAFFKKNTEENKSDIFYENQKKIEKVISSKNLKLEELRYLPVMAKKDWIAILTPEGELVEYLRGDGF